MFGCFFCGGSGACLCSIETSILASAIVWILDPAFRVRVTSAVSQTQGRREPHELRLVRRVPDEPGEAEARDPVPGSHVPQQRLELVEVQPRRLRHEDAELARFDHVGVERDVDGVRAVQRPLDRTVPGLHAGRLDELRPPAGRGCGHR